MELLLERWPEGLGATDSSGNTPLSVAVDYEHWEMAGFLLLQWPEADSDQSLDCRFVVSMGCNNSGTSSPDWQNAARSLRCSQPGRFSLPELQLWLQCGGDVGAQPQGTPLVELLEDEAAKAFLEELLPKDSINVLEDWRTWLVPAAAVIAAAIDVYIEQRLVKCQQQPEVAEDPFLEGAKKLVAPVFVRCVLLRRLLRLNEVCVAVFFVGFCLMLANWVVWLPVVALLYVVPGAAIHGCKTVLHRPILALTTDGLPSQVAALFRMIVVWGISLWMEHQLTEGTLPASWFSFMANPHYDSWYAEKVTGQWRNSRLQDDWPFGWAPESWTAESINEATLVKFSYLNTTAYTVYLFCAVLWGCYQRFCAKRQQIYTSGPGPREQVLSPELQAPSHPRPLNPNL